MPTGEEESINFPARIHGAKQTILPTGFDCDLLVYGATARPFKLTKSSLIVKLDMVLARGRLGRTVATFIEGVV